MSRPIRWTLLTRPECHLCEVFEEALRARFPQIVLELADVDSRADWQRRYGLKIPVLLDPQGAAVCATQFDELAVRRWVEGPDT